MFFQAVFLATAVKYLIDAMVAPIKRKYPNWDSWWLFYVAVVLGGVASWFAELNLFENQFPNIIIGRVATGLFVGGGSVLLHQVFKASGVQLIRRGRNYR